MDEIEKYLKEMISIFENDGGSSFNSDDILWIDEANHFDTIPTLGFNKPILVVNTGKSNLGIYDKE